MRRSLCILVFDAIIGVRTCFAVLVKYWIDLVKYRAICKVSINKHDGLLIVNYMEALFESKFWNSETLFLRLHQIVENQHNF